MTLAAFASAAQAQSPCTATAPAVGTEIRGPVLHILDGERLCVALGATPDQWVELQLTPEPLQKSALRPGEDSRSTLMGVAFAQTVTCRIIETAHVRPAALCRLEDQSLRALTRTPAAYAAGRVWR